MKKFIQNYINKGIKENTMTKIGIFFLVISIAGIIGFIYEVLFYFLDSGFTTFYWRCDNFLPWINIYAIGSILIFIFAYKDRKKPIIVFLKSSIVCGILELVSGYFLYSVLNLPRAWDYNKEILNFGNIGGFVCLRSVLFFGLASWLLIYLVIPFCYYLSKKMNKKIFIIFAVSVGSIFLIDEVYNHVVVNIFPVVKATDIYKSFGIKYKVFIEE